MIRLERLRLTDFRNHPSLDIAAPAQSAALIGPNGAGKTNVLEAISMFAPGRGLRGANLPDMLRRDAEAAGGGASPAWAVHGRFMEDGEEAFALGVGLERTGAGGWRRAARVDGDDAGPGELSAYVRAAWLTPAHDRLFAETASERRRFFDRLVAGHDPGHAVQAAAYERAMRHRTKALGEESRPPDPAWLSALEREMARAGAAVAAARVELLRRLQAEIDARPDSPFPKAALSLSGSLEEALLAGAAAGDVEDRFETQLARSRRLDAAAGRALEGPHRADLAARHQVKDMDAAQCSTGEQKALVTGLFLANARLLANSHEARGKALLLLLDEAPAHFDSQRRRALFTELEAIPAQAWMTGADEGLFAEASAGLARIGIGG